VPAIASSIKAVVRQPGAQLVPDMVFSLFLNVVDRSNLIGVSIDRQLIADHPESIRKTLSKQLCEAWNWVLANGALRDILPPVPAKPSALVPLAIASTNGKRCFRPFAIGWAAIRHELRPAGPGPSENFSLADLAHYRIAALELVDAIQCVSFHTPFLPKLHLTRGQLIDSEAACYPETRAWTQAGFDQRPGAQGIVLGLQA
jgi:hypothetical protein